MKVLIVDDLKLVRVVSRKILTTALNKHFDKPEIECSDSGMDAVFRCRNREYDLILMDVMMPGFDGIRATRTIRRIGENKQTYIAGFSFKQNDRATVLRATEAGVDSFIPKPLDPVFLDRFLQDEFWANK